MHTVVETPSYLAAAKTAGIDEALRQEIVRIVAERPEHGDILEGTGGFRKFRVARPGGGKSGGFRVVSYYYSPDLPVFLVTAFAKNHQSNLTMAERNALGKISASIIQSYRRMGSKR